MSSYVRRRRVGEQLQEELAKLIAHEVKDPRIGFVTVTEVRMSKDLRHARVYVSVMGDEEETEQSMKTLRRIEGFLRGQIGKRIRLRHVPELDFVIDETLARAERIEELLERSGIRELDPDEADGSDGGEEE